MEILSHLLTVQDKLLEGMSCKLVKRVMQGATKIWCTSISVPQLCTINDNNDFNP